MQNRRFNLISKKARTDQARAKGFTTYYNVFGQLYYITYTELGTR